MGINNEQMDPEFERTARQVSAEFERTVRLAAAAEEYRQKQDAIMGYRGMYPEKASEFPDAICECGEPYSMHSPGRDPNVMACRGEEECGCTGFESKADKLVTWGDLLDYAKKLARFHWHMLRSNF